MSYEEIKNQLERKGFAVVNIADNGVVVYAVIYSKNGKKIFDMTRGKKYNTNSERHLAIAVSRINDYVETDEDIEPFKEVEVQDEKNV